MSEIELGAIMWPSVVILPPQKTEFNGNPISVAVSVYRRGKGIFLVIVDCHNKNFCELTSLRPGDELCISSDGEDIGEIKRNPWWKRLWLRLTW